MDIAEYPLLNDPDLMLTVLRTAAGRGATLDDCLAAVHAALAEAGEAPPVGVAAVRARLEQVRRHLAAAGLIRPATGEPFRITDRGRAMLASHPDGVDDTVLMQFPEFRALIRAAARPAGHDDPHRADYEDGYLACQAGLPLSANPHPPDRVEHLMWENGWCQARDDAEREEAASRRP